MRQIQVEASRHGVRLFRNNVGTLKDALGNYVKYGLCVGSSDLVGWAHRHVDGAAVAVFVAVEVKSEKGRITEEQLNFIEAVKKAGGLAGVARSVEDAIRIFQGA